MNHSPIKYIAQFFEALHKCTNEKLLAFIEDLEESDEADSVYHHTQYQLALEEAKERGIKCTNIT